MITLSEVNLLFAFLSGTYSGALTHIRMFFFLSYLKIKFYATWPRYMNVFFNKYSQLILLYFFANWVYIKIKRTNRNKE